MNTQIQDPAIQRVITDAQNSFSKKSTKTVQLNGQQQTIPFPFPSPADWRDNWIYFLMIDRFNNPDSPPASSIAPNQASAWNQRFDFRQGGSFKGITAQLDYLAELGIGAIWISPVLKNSSPNWPFNYHGYAAQDFLSVDARFASDGTESTAEQELSLLIEGAHARGIYVILDIVINHSARVFDYNDPSLANPPQADFTNPEVMDSPMGDEPPVQWLNGLGFPRADWQNNLPAANSLSPDDAVWPQDLQRSDFFRRRGNRISDSIPPGARFVRGDFDIMRQVVMEYTAQMPGQSSLRASYGKTPVLNILITAYQYLIAKFDIDGFRMDTVKYVDPEMIQIFGNAIREFALSIGKKNFFTFGEVYDDESTIETFVGRNSGDPNGGFGIDAALDYPLFFQLPAVVKCSVDVSVIQQVFENRKNAEENILSSHGEAGRYFVTFLDNHDQNQRFNHPASFPLQILAGLAVLFSLQGIPCIYYGTEQGLQGTIDSNGQPDLNSPESVREALWGKVPLAFDQGNLFFNHVRQLSLLRKSSPALLYGRLYFREVSGDGQDFGLSQGVGGLLAYSRILSATEVVIVFNSSTSHSFQGFVLVDIDINRSLPVYTVAYSNLGTTGAGPVQINPGVVHSGGNGAMADLASKFVSLAPMEVQVLVPANA
jgi:glycosidase